MLERTEILERSAMTPEFAESATVEALLEGNLQSTQQFGELELATESERDGHHTADIQVEVVFELITQILPLEICLYHRIIPLSHQSGVLTLGMVDPSDEEARVYAERIVTYQGLKMEPVFIAGHTHQSLLSAYLNHIGQPVMDANDIESVERERRELDEEQDMESAELECPETRPTPASGIGAHRTLKVETPEKVDTVLPEALQQRAEDASHQPTPDQRGTLCLDITEVAALLGEDEKETLALPQHPADTVPQTAPGIVLPSLHVEIQHLMEPLEALLYLPAPQFLAELMGRILANGVTRVLLGSAGGPGRIAWERNGTAQLALDTIEPKVFRSLLAELKVLVGLPAAPVQEVTRRIVMRSYEGQPVMLKLSIEPTGLNAMRSPYGPGEKIQMQVLRGARLISHEQQRLAQLERETLAMAQLLQRKLQQMQLRRQTLPALKPDFEVLEELAVVTQTNYAFLPMLG